MASIGSAGTAVGLSVPAVEGVDHKHSGGYAGRTKAAPGWYPDAAETAEETDRCVNCTPAAPTKGNAMLTMDTALNPAIERVRGELRAAEHRVFLARDAAARCRTERTRNALETALEQLEAAQIAADAAGVDWLA